MTRKPRVTEDQANLAIVHHFAQAYSRHYGSGLSTPIHRDQPDFAGTDTSTGQVLGIEVTYVYQDAGEVEMNNCHCRDWGIISGHLEGLVAHISRALAE